ncbi:MAG: PepSY domain-containing protein [Mangrovicoccus sp.]|nr:PepSY domain-containing protein [Mangrovicoccus sp.]
MSFRRTVFWFHLVIGVGAGLVIFLLAVTGALLSFETQVIAAVDRAGLPAISAGAPLGASALAGAALNATAGKATALVIPADPVAPVAASLGRGAQVYLDPVTGAVLGPGNAGVRGFFGMVEDLHRWLALSDASRDTGRAITGATNLVFLLLLLSGLWLWLPPRLGWPMLRQRLVFRRGLPNAKARDWNWHHVFGIWAWLALLLIVGSGVVLSYPAARTAVFAAFGETAGRGGPPGAAVPSGTPVADPRLDAVLVAATAADPDWNRLTLPIPATGADSVTVTLDTGSGRNPRAQTRLTYDLYGAALTRRSGFADTAPGQKTFVFLRFGHTGEIFGLAGQAVAVLASLAAAVMVWTGLALTWRRLLQPLLRRRRARAG